MHRRWFPFRVLHPTSLSRFASLLASIQSIQPPLHHLAPLRLPFYGIVPPAGFRPPTPYTHTVLRDRWTVGRNGQNNKANKQSKTDRDQLSRAGVAGVAPWDKPEVAPLGAITRRSLMTSATRTSPDAISPDMMRFANTVSTSLWIVRLRGRAP